MKNMSRLVLVRLSEAWFVGDEFAANGSHDKRFLSNIGGLLRWIFPVESRARIAATAAVAVTRYDRDPT